MISYQIIEHGKPLQKVLSETPQPKGGEVLVRITRSGVCHSDLHIWQGYFDWGGGKRFYVKERGCVPPFTLGHEPLGIVAALGRRARCVKVGQKRLVCPWIGRGKRALCRGCRQQRRSPWLHCAGRGATCWSPCAATSSGSPCRRSGSARSASSALASATCRS